MSERGKGKRLYLTLPSGIYAALERWAEDEDNKPASLGAYIIEKEVREAIENGKIPAANKSYISIPADLQKLLLQLMRDELPSNEQIVILAQGLGIETKVLIEIRDLVHKKGLGE